MKFREFAVAPQVLDKARRIGMYGNVEKRVARMARSAAPVTHPLGNRRFESFLLKVENGIVTDLLRYDPTSGEAWRDHARKEKVLLAVAKHFGTGKHKH